MPPKKVRECLRGSSEAAEEKPPKKTRVVGGQASSPAAAAPVPPAPAVPVTARRGKSTVSSSSASTGLHQATEGARVKSVNGRGRVRARGSDAAAAEAAAQDSRGNDRSGSSVVKRGADMDALLENSWSAIGEGARATVLFHESSFDSALILLEPGGTELREKNVKSLELLYFVTEAEDGQVEFSLPSRGSSKRLSKGGEILVPADVEYVFRNNSRTSIAKIVAVVPV